MNKKKLKKKLCRKFKKLLIRHKKELEVFLEHTNPKYWNKFFI